MMFFDFSLLMMFSCDGLTSGPKSDNVKSVGFTYFLLKSHVILTIYAGWFDS